MNAWISWPRVSIALAVAGIAIAGYLSYVSFDADALTCQVGDCGTVQSSDYAKIAGVPIAILGLEMFLSVFGLGLLRVYRPDYGEPIAFALFAITLSSTVYHGYLTYIEIRVLDAICQWCVISSLVTVGLLVSEGVQSSRLLRD